MQHGVGCPSSGAGSLRTRRPSRGDGKQACGEQLLGSRQAKSKVVGIGSAGGVALTLGTGKPLEGVEQSNPVHRCCVEQTLGTQVKLTGQLGSHGKRRGCPVQLVATGRHDLKAEPGGPDG